MSARPGRADRAVRGTHGRRRPGAGRRQRRIGAGAGAAMGAPVPGQLLHRIAARGHGRRRSLHAGGHAAGGRSWPAGRGHASRAVPGRIRIPGPRGPRLHRRR
ncbi:hypothetical protein G6F50_018307 [Rhizopus delemar]|uniref:Uncharacterized protein n=1 Tax=Rhizopus delemar TaxID=936053 RepID=A0A9P6XMT8_9FUNG|nr:hypothetical protein G6F50_018307 [Rhizopus delemar]